MSSPGRAARLSAAVLTIVASLVSPAPARGGEIAGKVFRGLAAPFQAVTRAPPATGIDCAVEDLATQIDWLEHAIDRDGSVVAKEPDVWGQSRLTRYRREYEAELAKKLGTFEELNNASLARSDQAFLGLALAINAASAGPAGPVPSGTVPPGFSSQQVMNLISTGSQGPVPFEATAPSALLTTGSLQTLYGRSGENPARINLEPTIHLDHLSRYLHHLHELRRINEGDDTGDSPGYALNLVRIPVSILPGKHTQRGHGAEITVTADLQLGDDLLPTTFRNLVINDLVDVIGPSLTFAVNDPELLAEARGQQERERTLAAVAADEREAGEKIRAATVRLAGQLAKRRGIGTASVERELESLPLAVAARTSGGAEAPETMLVLPEATRQNLLSDGADEGLVDDWLEQRNRVARLAATRETLGSEVSTARADLARRLRRASPLAAPSGKSRRARLPIPLSQLPDVAGDKQVAAVILQTFAALQADPYNQPQISYMAVRGFLGEELQAAYDFLALPEQQHVWAELPGWGLPELIRGRQTNRLEERRCAYFSALGIDEPSAAGMPAGMPCGHSSCRDPRSACCNAPCCRPICRTFTAVLAWSILCDSALLNQRLIEDMQEAATAKGRVSPAAGGLAGPFFGPAPSPQARQAFNDYVRIRWPIRVFALDPVTQEQNVEDAYSMRREMQIAMALAASRGRAGTQAMMRYARRLETDLATIALNKTVVGFSHGSDTFGWRFYPRVQTPPTRNNLVTFADTLVGTNSTTRDLAERRLEPGLRECTAIVVMPSFVPYATFDVRSNWFSLTHPASTDLSMRKTIELSRSVKAMQRSAAVCAAHADAYRDGEVARLLRRVEQLDRELPLQSLLAQIPFENTAGGFELFNTGVTDLAPELMGWYGGTGIDPQRPTSLFIVGKGFSVHDTKVIAGGLSVVPELVSREVMKITIPPGVRCICRPPEAGCVPGHAPPPAAALRSPPPLARGARQPAIRQVANEEAGLVLADSLPAPGAPAEPPAAAGAPAPEAVLPWEPAEALPSPAVLPDCDEPPAGRSACAAPAAAWPERYVDIHLATPYGVSGHLLIPLVAHHAAVPDEAVESTACALVITPPVSIALTARPTSDETGVWRVNEYFESVPDSIAIRVPRWFVTPADAQINWTIREPGTADEPGTVVAKLTTPAPHFEAAASAYVFDGGELRNLIGDTSRPATDKTFRGAIKPYLDHLGAQSPGSIDRRLQATAALVVGRQSVPIEGALDFTVTMTTPPPKK